MKYHKNILILFVLIMNLSCNKENIDMDGYTATLSVVNAIPDYNGSLKMNFTGKTIHWSDAAELNYQSSDGLFSNGALNFGISTRKDVPLVIVSSKDTLKPIFDRITDFKRGEIYSLFITGKYGSAVTILNRDVIPVYTDSLTGVRFVNLSPDNIAVTVNVAGNVDAPFIRDLPYKDISTFIPFPANRSVSNYLFEVRKATTGKLLCSYRYTNIARYKNVTLVIRGLEQGFPGMEMVRINN
ncbi:DUF4397 domain-containing protein [Chitinophaga tropicalis]|uniref:DUF4397 domain-containing protein n=1 Tax=Chitinophaga tropicalis TaxID=2683588 RepID=A0A7K1U7Q2_9BACT|nr:DUF4397 domain-containing protein [Chitinophaga tropicalis]MVT10379.1 hypothetical protein [Chitinophaga tropicalis]